MNSKELIKNQIGDYIETIHAILGFANFYLFDGETRKDRNGVRIFQGCRLERKIVDEGAEDGNGAGSYVTPDLGVYLPSNEGVIGEVKRNLPIDQERWMSMFRQVMNYDSDLLGWPSSDGTVPLHDVVLIIHLFRSVQAVKFYQAHKDKIKFARPFAIVAFSKTEDGGKHYYLFRKELGHLSFPYADKCLDDSVPVPMKILIDKYSMVKLSDNLPPLPYLMDIIWQHVVLPKAATHERFSSLRQKQKIEVLLAVDEVVEELRKGFSFAALPSCVHDRQAGTPRRAWVVNAFDKLVLAKEAEWLDANSKSEIKIFFQRHQDTLEHFVEMVADKEDDKQMPLFV